ncbi:MULTISPECIES: hypothetical protein [Psychrilyobacter]|uniref:Uncharacterized protein n=2 Tax=Psychrilyobacter TaxID=623282 RepID=A0ABX9KHC9_9FUSO|nr:MULTISPECIES: hypothetical protein [Psychrilyobacter]NDI77814.1 hypothetical protein [Psychrilyobacter piezotolerans]RDE62333.1 hypothetical protein DV867_07110 [Psychrilyobacter sp. S5]REI41431.1 hypothetical protein DYH56_07110 [Psychrilyobacter piezotolerans]
MSTEKIKGMETKGEGFIVSWTNLKKCGYIKCNGRKFLINDKNFGYDEIEKIELLEALKGKNRYLKVEFIIVTITKRNTFLKKIRLKKIKSKDDLYFEEIFLGEKSS